MQMTLEQLVKPALDALKGKLGSPVADLRYEFGTDSTGDPAVFVWVILDDRAGPKARFPRLEAISERIRDTVRATIASQLDLAAFFPYVYFRTESEQAEVESGQV